jgi:WD40 repeat protein
MASINGFSFGAFVVEAGFLDKTAAFALGDGSVRLFDGAEARGFKVHGGAVLTATVSRDGKMMITGGDDGVVALTDEYGAATRIAERPGKWIDVVAAGPGGVVGFAVGKTTVVRFADGRERTLDQDKAVGGLAFAPKGVRVAIAGYNGAVLWWPGTDAQPVPLTYAGAHNGATFSPDGRYLMTSMQENALHGWRIEDAQDMRMSGYTAKPRSMSWSVKGKYLASSGAGAAILWPFLTKDGPINKTPLQLGPASVLVTRVACHPRDEVVAVGYANGMINLVRIADRQQARIRQGGEGPISALAFDKTGANLAFGTEQGAAGVIEL